MGKLREIVEGHVNELFDRRNDLREQRENICKSCGLYKESHFGPICNPNKYINVDDKTTISDIPRVGYKRGCSCRLQAKWLSPNSKCIVGKW